MYRYLFVIQGPVNLFLQERCFNAETSCISMLKWRPLTRRQMLRRVQQNQRSPKFPIPAIQTLASARERSVELASDVYSTTVCDVSIH